MPAITVCVSLRLPPELLDRVDALAARGGVSRNAWLVAALWNTVPPGSEAKVEMRGLEPIVRNALASGNALEGVSRSEAFREVYEKPLREMVRPAREFKPYPKKGDTR